jgi:hypothetical protein
MKKAFLYIAVSIVIVLLIIVAVKLSGEKYYESKDYTWYAAIGTKDGDLLIRGAKIDKIKNNINKLIQALNKSNKDPETFRTPKDKEPTSPPKLKLKNIKDQVVNLKVINAEYLTQRMGSTGAEEFLAVATFTLTEYDNIKFVNFIFEEGDHAVPGLYSRQYFLKNWKVAK